MKQRLLKSMLLLCALVVGGASSAWGEEETITYTFTSKSWTATVGGATANWTSGKDGGGYSNNGIQVTSAETQTGANGTSPRSFNSISKIVVTYNTNKTAGAGTIVAQIGSNEAKTNDVAYSSGDGRTANYTTTFNYTTPETGSVKLTVNTTTNSIYLCSVSITYGEDTRAATTVTLNDGYSTEVYMGEDVVSPSLNKVSTASADIDGATVTWSSTAESVATINESTGAISIQGPGVTTIKASYAGTTNAYKPSEASYTLNVYNSYNSIEALQDGATSTSTKMKVTFTNAKVTALKDTKNAYVVEGEKGIIIYNSSAHGLTAGQIINGTLRGANVVLYKGATEITGFSQTDLTVTNGSVPDPVVKTIDELSAANVGLIATIEEVTYNSTSETFTDGNNDIKFFDAFSKNPTLENGKTYNVTGMVNFYNNVQISPLAASDVVEITSKTTPTSVWKSGGNEVTSLAFTKGGLFSATFETNSTGAKSFESSNTAVATIDNNGTITLTGTVGITTITATTEANPSYFASTATLTLTVREAVEDGIFNFGNFQDYGSGIIPGNDYYTEDATWNAGNISLKTTGKYRWFIANTGIPDLRLYGNDPNSTMKVTAPEGYVITKIDGLSSNLTPDAGTITSTTWKGKAQSVTFTYGSTSGSVTIKSLAVYYSEPTISFDMGEIGYMTYCNKNAAISFGDLEAYVVSNVGENSVTLTEIKTAPAGTPVVLKGTKGEHTLTILESADAVGTNKLYCSTGETTTTDALNIYALANKTSGVGFYLVKKDVIVPNGKCYIKVAVSNSVKEFYPFEGFDSEDGIENVNVNDNVNDGAVYDLSGRQVQKPTRGIYLVNGKKILF